MNGSWGVYEVRGRLPGGKEVPAAEKGASGFFVRWRVNSVKRRRSFKTRGPAREFRETLITAKNRGWEADAKGWPIDPAVPVAPSPAAAAAAVPGWTVETYIEQVWWPTISANLADKNRIGQRRNADLAIQLLRLKEGDPRLHSGNLRAGESIPIEAWISDDTKAALVARSRINSRTAAVNQRRLRSALVDESQATLDVVLKPEIASKATVLHFKVTLGMIAKSAVASGKVSGDPMADTSRFAPKPQPSRRRDRLVPDLDELFDLADAISQLGPLMGDGRPRGARFRSLILCAGTTGPRTGELVAHHPEWIDWDSAAAEIRFHKTEAAVYGAVLKPEERGRRERPLKHREDDDYRAVPLIADVRSALAEHCERGYSSNSRTWLSSTGRGHLDFALLKRDYWIPALSKVFGDTAKDRLASAQPGILRKTAITWWSDSGINQAQAAEWAGHAEEVATIYYASRASTTFTREVARLESNGRGPFEASGDPSQLGH